MNADTSFPLPVPSHWAVTDGPVIFDSSEEEWFSWMLQELQDAGYILWWRRAPSFTLMPALRAQFFKGVKPKKGPVFVEKDMVQDVTYSPDFICEWVAPADHDHALYQTWNAPRISERIPFLGNLGTDMRHLSYFEVKPVFDRVGKTLLGTIKAKWLLCQHGIYVQMVKIGNTKNSFFDKAFTPSRFLKTDITGKPRSIKYMPRTLGECITLSQQQHAAFIR